MPELKNMAKQTLNFDLIKVVVENDRIVNSVIEIMIARFPHLVTHIFKELDDKTLTICRYVSRLCCDYLDSEKILLVRMIQTYRNFTEISSPDWNRVLKNTSVELVKELSVSTQQFFKDDVSRNAFHWSPLQIVAEQGKLELCKYILERNKNSKTCIKYNNDLANRYTHPLSMAAKKGHEEICKVLFDDSEEKNPSDILGMTTFHFAAEKGLTDVCKLIIENVDNKNPAALNGCTPLHLAAKKGHLKIIRLIVDSGVDKYSLFDGKTPLDLAGGIFIPYFSYKLLSKSKTQLCGKIFIDIMCIFVGLFIMFLCLYCFMIVLIFPVFGTLVPNWSKFLDKYSASQVFGVLNLGILVSFVTTFFLIIILALILNIHRVLA